MSTKFASRRELAPRVERPAAYPRALNFLFLAWVFGTMLGRSVACEWLDREQRPVVAAITRTQRPHRRRSSARPEIYPASVPGTQGGRAQRGDTVRLLVGRIRVRVLHRFHR